MVQEKGTQEIQGLQRKGSHRNRPLGLQVNSKWLRDGGVWSIYTERRLLPGILARRWSRMLFTTVAHS